MIALAESVPYGCNTLRYITGETPNKEHPERVYHIFNNLMEDGLDARDMWDSFKLTLARYGKLNGRLKNSVISFMLSPPPDKVKDYNHDDWKKVGLDFLAIYDKIKLSDESGKVYSEPTNILGSKFTMWLHLDSDSGVPHLHIAALRIDMDGMTNNDHQILQRAQHAEEILAQRLKWQTAREVREDHKQDLEHNCREILGSMPTFSYDAYFNALRGLKEGYVVETKRDSEERYVSYVVCDGCKRYPASTIGKSRRFTVAHLEDTWKRLREQELARLKALQQAEAKRIADELKTRRDKVESKPGASVQTPRSNSARASQQERRSPAAPIAPPRDYTKWQAGTTSYDYSEGGRQTRYHLPAKVMEFYNEEFNHTAVRNWDDLTRLAVGVFVGAVLGPSEQPSIGTGGGGPSSDLPWRDKDEDDLHWARRCAQYATRKLGKKIRCGRSR